MRSVHRPDGRPIGFLDSALPAGVLLALVLWGLMARPLLLGQAAIPLEVVFVFAAAFAIGHLFWLGFPWARIQDAIVADIRIGRHTEFLRKAVKLRETAGLRKDADA